MALRARILATSSLALALAACHQASVAAASAQGTATPATTRVERLDPAIDALIPRDARVEKLADGFDWVEGPVWRRDKGYLLFSDIPKNTIYKWKEGEGISVFLRPAGYTGATPQGRELGSNGLTTDAQGRLVVADHGNRLIARVSDSLFTKTVLADRYEGKRFNSPNDVVFRANGDLYFTDPPYGLFKLNADSAKELPFNGVYRLSPSGVVTLLARDLTFPNGIAISPDGNTLYVAISDGKNPYIMAYDIQTDGNVARGRIFFNADSLVKRRLPGALDGMKVDAKGNLFATGPGGILVISPQGKHLGTIVTGDLTANVGFGDDGSTLYITANHALLRIRTSTKGQGF
ncbi:MAG: SMP-30/Gluconolaconase/LRE-like region-containing protein [Gemmatimonadetes bacterium]|nr:SMP-30/Gluconolaconase/LRE-like region-containing protein [Gemmatimonadota bacterium]